MRYEPMRLGLYIHTDQTQECLMRTAPYASWLVFTCSHLSCSPAVRDKPSSSHNDRTLRQPTSFIIQITLTSRLSSEVCLSAFMSGDVCSLGHLQLILLGLCGLTLWIICPNQNSLLFGLLACIFVDK